ncbi:cell division protein FtsB [Candidatus Vallotia cooleyia]|uniref:cell division protein FtsB n=1 Tax=Candidatus Vallotiella adelgis TaxID=1177211 RepID=UPI001D01D535|nr:cell division protein FtsB [Candidatus Vallotia cooleyia]UDG82315.1 Cell division protein FtsB [Candidatus Vallotia cooleyia]
MRIITIVFVGLIALIQFPLWWGHGGWLHVYDLQKQLRVQQHKNKTLKLRNKQIASEVQDLRVGTTAVEERARYTMGMIKEGEVFVQFVSQNVLAISALVSPTIISTHNHILVQPICVVTTHAQLTYKPGYSRSRKML